MAIRRTGAWIFSRVFENKSFQYRISNIHNQCIAGLNRRAGYATVRNSNMEYQTFFKGVLDMTKGGGGNGQTLEYFLCFILTFSKAAWTEIGAILEK
jgi:hypothetical protein